jgi:hypothetical protein
MRKPLALAATAALCAALAATASPAQADTGVTNVSFQVAAGTLTIATTATAPSTTAELGGSGATATVPLGTTTIKDTRLIGTSWSYSATASNFTTTGGSVSKDQASFHVQAGWTAPAGMVLPTFSSPPATTPQAADANGSRTLMTTLVGVLNNGVTFTPVLTVAVPAGSPAGTYTGTVTQSVA